MLIEYLDNRNISSIDPIRSPLDLKAEIPNNNSYLVTNTRQEIRDVLRGDDPRLLVVVGPCSIHDTNMALDYATKLSRLRKQFDNELVIVMRTYLEKPRTTRGWTGLAYDPNLDGSGDPDKGLTVCRQLLADVNSMGLPCATEVLDNFTPQYTADLVSWAAVGARTTESQPHRQLVSGLSMPVGFKNSTEGNITVAVDGMESAKGCHTFYGMDQEGRVAKVRTTGNQDTHIVLRGGGTKGTNYDETSIKEAINLMLKRDLLTEANRPIMVDCSHANSSKDHTKQPAVMERVMDQIKAGQKRIMGVMIESNLKEGRQNWVEGKQLEYGVSITDACVGWKETRRMLIASARILRPKIYIVPAITDKMLSGN